MKTIGPAEWRILVDLMSLHDFKGNIHYTGYITYANDPYDRKCAHMLYRALISYRVAKSVAKQRQGLLGSFYVESIDPVKLDCFRLDEQLILKNSDFLIIVCSPQTKNSVRIRQQIQYFQDQGRNSKILVLLVRGDPAASFPEQLIRTEIADQQPENNRTQPLWSVEPLAANIVADTMFRARLKLQTEKLRILCRLIGCSFDDLKQRQRERKRIFYFSLLSASLLAMAIMGTFMAVTWQEVMKEKEALGKNRAYAIEKLNYSLSYLPDQFKADPVIGSIVNQNACSFLYYLLANDTELLDQNQLKQLEMKTILAVQPYDTPRSVSIKASMCQKMGDSGKAIDIYEAFRKLHSDDRSINMFLDNAEAFLTHAETRNIPCGIYIDDAVLEGDWPDYNLKTGDIIVGYMLEKQEHTINHLDDIEFFYVTNEAGSDIIMGPYDQPVGDLRFIVLRMGEDNQFHRVTTKIDPHEYVDYSSIYSAFVVYELYQQETGP